MSDKEDPLGQTLWIDAASMEQARESWWQAFQEMRRRHMLQDEADKNTWDIAWAAAMAGHAYLTEGRLGPRR